MKIYKIAYIDEYKRPWEAFDGIEIVKAKELADYVETMNANGRICEENYNEFLEKHPKGVVTEKDAVELLEMDGYTIEWQKI